MAGKNKNTVPLIGVILLMAAMLVLVYFFFFRQPSWIHSYDPNEKEPYDTYLVYELLQSVRNNQEFILIKDSCSSELPVDPGPKSDNYIYIGNHYYADSADISRLMDFASNGNNVFVFSEDVESYLFDSLTSVTYTLEPPLQEMESAEDSEADSLVTALTEDVDSTQSFDAYEEESGEYPDSIYTSEPDNLYNEQIIDEEPVEVIPDEDWHPDIQKIYYSTDTTIEVFTSAKNKKRYSCEVADYYKFEATVNNWPYFSDNLILRDGTKPEIIGYYDQGYQNFIRFPYGKGYIYFHSTPLVFTNYFLRNDSAMRYCRQALSYLGDGKIYWDEENRTFDSKGTRSRSYSPQPNEGPLEFILSEPGLRWAWYLLLLSALLYLLFGAKRKQRIIRKQDKMDNTSIEYAEVLSQLFMKQTDHYRLVRMKMDLFKSFLRFRYGARLSEENYSGKEDELKEISVRSGIDPGLVQDIFRKFNSHRKSGYVDYNSMLDFHGMLEYFYQNCK